MSSTVMYVLSSGIALQHGIGRRILKWIGTVLTSKANGSKMSTLPHPKNQANRKVTESSEAAIKR